MLFLAGLALDRCCDDFNDNNPDSMHCEKEVKRHNDGFSKSMD